MSSGVLRQGYRKPKCFYACYQSKNYGHDAGELKRSALLFRFRGPMIAEHA
jgi:hypothetical protein